MSPTRLVFLRHGQTEWNHTGRLQGQADVHLDDVGLRQARDVARVLGRRHFAAVYSSDLLRARTTAEAVAADLGLDVVLDPRLREINVGSWSGLTSAQVEEQFPDYGSNYFRGIDFKRSATGESVAEMVARAMPAVDDIAAAHQGQEVLVVAHGFLIRQLLQTMLGIEDSGRVLGGLGNAHWSEAGIADGRTWLVSHNVGFSPSVE